MNAETNPVVTLIKRITFCAGHRLLHHGGKCENLHGHNYTAHFCISGEKTDAVGRLVDFSVINRLFKSWIDENWDHAMVIWESDTDALEALRSVSPNRIFELPWNPTAENMARYLVERVGPELLGTVSDYNLRLTRVALWETESSCAEVSIGEPARQTEWSASPTWQQTWSG